MLTPEIRLTGKIDKIELLNDGEANVVDYKTGHPKTQGEIEGSTKNSNGDIKRQLVFYNLLLNKYENGRYKMISGDIDFVEPDDKGKYHKERFFIGAGGRRAGGANQAICVEILGGVFGTSVAGRRTASSVLFGT